MNCSIDPPTKLEYEQLVGPLAAKAAQPLLVLQFFGDNSFEYPDVNRRTIFAFVKSVFKHLDLAEDVVGTEAFPRLKARDVRKLVSSLFSSSTEASINVRQHVILVYVAPFCAMVFKDRCLLFLPDGADGILGMFMDKFQSQIEEDRHSVSIHANADLLDFEFRALETILAALIQYYDKIVKSFAMDSEHYIKKVEQSISTADLESIRLLKNDVGIHLSRIESVRRTLVALVDEDEDICLMHLTRFAFYSSKCVAWSLMSVG